MCFIEKGTTDTIIAVINSICNNDSPCLKDEWKTVFQIEYNLFSLQEETETFPALITFFHEKKYKDILQIEQEYEMLDENEYNHYKNHYKISEIISNPDYGKSAIMRINFCLENIFQCFQREEDVKEIFSCICAVSDINNVFADIRNIAEAEFYLKRLGKYQTHLERKDIQRAREFIKNKKQICIDAWKILSPYRKKDRKCFFTEAAMLNLLPFFGIEIL